MALTQLDQMSALIVVDLQCGMLDLPFVHQIAGIVSRAATLAEAFRSSSRPVVLVNTDGAAPGRREQDAMSGARSSGWTDLVPELGATSQDHRVTKRSPGAFTDTGLEAFLKAAGVTHIVVIGVATGTGVEMTARQGYETGFNVTLATDAMTDMDADVHANSVTRIFPRIGETGSTEAIARLLDDPRT